MSDAPTSNVSGDSVSMYHYTDEQKKLVNSPLYRAVCAQAIADMDGYAVDHGLYEDPVPEEVYKKGHVRNTASFIWHCISNSLYNNPYRVPPPVYLTATGLFVLYFVQKTYVAIQMMHVAREMQAAGKHPDWYDKLVSAMDSWTNVLPLIVTLMLYLFPPLIANM